MFSPKYILGLQLLVVAFLMLVDGCAAQSTLVYRQGPVLLNTPSQSDLDLNQDGVTDYRFTGGILAGLPSPGLPSTSTPYVDTFAFNRNDYLLNSEGRIVLKQAGVVFGPDTASGESWGHRDSEAQAIAYAAGNTWPGFSGQPSEAFLGVRFLSGGVPHYGWIHFVVPVTNPPAVFPVIADWAYESRSNTAIRAGAKPATVHVGATAIVQPGYLRLHWQADAGKAYQVQSKDSLVEPLWANLDFVVVGTTTNTAVDLPITGTAKFFQIVEAD